MAYAFAPKASLGIARDVTPEKRPALAPTHDSAPGVLGLTRDVDLLSRFVAIGRPEILRDFSTDSCIPSTRIALDVLREFFDTVQPMTVRAYVLNAAMVRKVMQTQRFAEGDELARWIRDGAWTAALGYGAAKTRARAKWPGHLVAIVERRWLVDLALDQVSNPLRGLNLAPDIVPITERFLQGQERLDCVINGCYVTYKAFPSDKSYRVTAAWRNAQVARAASAIRAKLRNASHSDFSVGERVEEKIFVTG